MHKNDEIFKELERDLTIATMIGKNFIRQLIISDSVKPTTKVYMYKEENHKTPHIHVYYGKEQSISLNISTGEKLAGNLSPKLHKKVKDWVLRKKEHLLENWNSIQKGEKPELVWTSNA